MIWALMTLSLFIGCNNSPTDEGGDGGEVAGCTNPSACNYESSATEDDGTCAVCLGLEGNSLTYSSVYEIAGFQFDHDGCVTCVSGGDAGLAGFSLSSSESAVLGFSIVGATVPMGSGTLVILAGAIIDECLSNFIVSGPGGEDLTAIFSGDN